jgi:KaiC/GvpD/RAD55 family RecA-like ATPase
MEWLEKMSSIRYDFERIPLYPAWFARMSGGLRLLTPTECEAQPGRAYVVKGLFAEGDLGCIFGPPGTGKSIVAPHIGYAVARGRAAFRLRTKRGPVFYIAAEDPHGMSQRIRALKQIYADTWNFMLVKGVSNLRDDRQLADLVRLIERWKPRMIVIDTIALAFPGIDENASADMGCVVAVGRKLGRHGAAVILIHHDTKAGTGTPRGHSVLNGALDVALHLTRDDATKIVQGRLTKNRNGPCDLTIAFQIRGEHIGVDEDGDVVTAPVAVELTAEQARPAEARLPSSAAAVLRVLRGLLADGRCVVPESEWRAATRDDRAVSTAEDPESRSKAFRRAYKELLARKLVVFSDGYVSLAAIH